MQHHPGSWYLPWGVPLQKMVAVPIHPAASLHQQLHHHPALVQPAMLAGLPAPLTQLRTFIQPAQIRQPTQRKICGSEKEKGKLSGTEKRKADDGEPNKDLKKAKLETKALKAKRPGFTDDRYNETSYYIENGLRKVYPYYFTFTTFTKGRWVGERILDVFAREFRAHPAEEYERCIRAGTLTVNYEKVPTDYKLKHNDLLANVVHRHEVPVTCHPITIVHMDEDVVVVNKPASIPHGETLNYSGKLYSCKVKKFNEMYRRLRLDPITQRYSKQTNRVTSPPVLSNSQSEIVFSQNTNYFKHETPVLAYPIRLIHVDEDLVVLDKPCSLPVHPCGRYRHNTVVFILAKEYNLKNLRTIHRLDRLTSGLLLFGRSPKKARQMEHQIRNRLVQKEYVCRVEGEFPSEVIECREPIEVVSYKIGVCKVSPNGKDCVTVFQKLGFNGKTSIVLCKPRTGRMHQIRVHLQYLGYPVVNDPLYNHVVFGPAKGRNGDLGGKTDEELVRDLINIHNAENWLGMDGDSDLSMFKPMKTDLDDSVVGDLDPKVRVLGDDDAEPVSREPSPCEDTCDTNGDSLIPSLDCRSNNAKVTVATQTGHEAPDLAFNPDKMTVDKHCYECKVRYRDPKPQDLVMYLHAWKYKGPDWEYETELPDWARHDWTEEDLV